MTKVFGYLTALGLATLQVIYNTWAVVLVWNTWLGQYHVMTWGEVIGINLILGWTRTYKHIPEDEMPAYAVGTFKYELFQPLGLVIVSTVLKWWLQ